MTDSTIVLVVEGHDADNITCRITISESVKFKELMCASEYLCAVVASRSNLGFEAALDLIAAGAVTWKTTMRSTGDSDE